MESTLFPEDLLISVFHYFPEKIKEFPADRETIHRAFYKVSRDYPEIFKGFAFKKDKLFPTCSSLDQALHNLQYCHLIEIPVPSLKEYRLNKESIDSLFRDLEPNLNPLTKNQIQEIAANLYPILTKN